MQFLEEQYFLVCLVEDSRVGGWCYVRKVGCPGV